LSIYFEVVSILKLGKRLQRIEAMVAPEYAHIWDCCCDHGLLGASLLARQAAPTIHFVDTVPKLMDELEAKLQRFFPDVPAQYQTHCRDVTTLPLWQYVGRQLVIIAGVGGQAMAGMVASLHRQCRTTAIDFLLCPVRDQFALRQQLIRLDFGLIDEVLLEENRRFYEILWVSSGGDPQRPRVSAVGESFWQTDCVEQAKVAADYLSKTLDHYRRMQRGRGAEVGIVIEAYRGVRT